MTPANLAEAEVAREIAAARELIDKYPHGTYGCTWVFALVHLSDERDAMAAENGRLRGELAAAMSVIKQRAALPEGGSERALLADIKAGA